MPPNTIYVGRPTTWGNPFTGPDAVPLFRQRMEDNGSVRPDLFELTVAGPLRGKNRACWCPLNRSCHADVLLALANAPR
jgi:hypothetical protein